MDLDDVYSTIRQMDSYKKVYSGYKSNKQFYGIGEYDVISFEYDDTGESSINIVCPRDRENNFMYVEINNDGLHFTKILNGGKQSISLDLSEEEKFFQEDTIINLGFSLSEYKVLHKDFMKYYNGFLKELTLHL